MTPEEFRAALKDLGMRQVHFAEITGMAPTTVSRWVKGIQPMPQWVVVFLRTLITLDRAIALIVALSPEMAETIHERLAVSGTRLSAHRETRHPEDGTRRRSDAP